jgi:hypothetical protein
VAVQAGPHQQFPVVVQFQAKVITVETMLGPQVTVVVVVAQAALAATLVAQLTVELVA